MKALYFLTFTRSNSYYEHVNCLAFHILDTSKSVLALFMFTYRRTSTPFKIYVYLTAVKITDRMWLWVVMSDLIII